MDYIYCIKRGKVQNLPLGLAYATVPVHQADYCFKLWSDGFYNDGAKKNARALARKTNSPVRQWRSNNDSPNGKLFTTDFEDNSPVYRCLADNPVFRDESQLGGRFYPCVGKLIMCNSGLVVHIDSDELNEELAA